MNIYGLFIDIRKENLHLVDQQLLRFNNDQYLTYEESLEKLKEIYSNNDIEYALEANKLVQQSLTHVKWSKVNRVEFRQLIPIWDNFFLFFLGLFYDDPQIQRYHFVDYQRSLERGIGICGDASMVLSQILDKKQINNRIVSFKGHVITEVDFKDGKNILLDPDFGVEIQMSLDELVSNPNKAKQFYIDAGYSDFEATSLSRIYGTKHNSFESDFEFMPKRYIFEYTSYILKWIIPILLIMLPIWHRFKIRPDPSFANSNIPNDKL